MSMRRTTSLAASSPSMASGDTARLGSTTVTAASVSRSLDEFGQDVEKRADWLLTDIRKMGGNSNSSPAFTSTAARGGLRASMPAGAPTTQRKPARRSTIELSARGATALASFKTTRSVDFDFQMSRRPGGRDPTGWDDGGGEEQRRQRGGAEDGTALLAATADRGVTESMRLDPDPGGFREKYLQTFNGLQGYSKDGVTKLDYLVGCANEALAKARVPSKSGFRFGAAVMTKDDKVFTACNVESSVDALSSSAERTAVLKAATEGYSDFLGLAISSDADHVDAILPDGNSRQFLSEFGDFDVYIVGSGSLRKRYTTYELFPSAERRVPKSPMKTRVERRGRATNNTGHRGAVGGRSALDKALAASTGEVAAQHEHNAHQWTVWDVVRWVEEDLELPTLGANFARNAVDGALLLQLAERDLEDMLGVKLPMHRRKLLMAINRLRDKDLLEYGVDVGRIEDYMALLDADRVKIVTKLKAAFDRVDKNGDGAISAEEVQSAFKQLGQDNSLESVFAWIRNRDENKDGKVSFEEFVMAYTALFAETDEVIVEKNKRIIKSRGGRHLSTRRRTDAERAADSNNKNINGDRRGASAAEDADSDHDVRRRDSLLDDNDKTRRQLSPLDVDTIAQLKRVFDVVDADRDGMLDHDQCCRAFAQLALRVSRKGIKEYLLTTPATASGKVTFYDFNRAFVAFIDNTAFREREQAMRRNAERAWWRGLAFPWFTAARHMAAYGRFPGPWRFLRQ